MTCSTMTGIVTSSESQTIWIGCDISKADFDAALWFPLKTGEGRAMSEIPVRSFPRSRSGLSVFLSWIEVICKDLEGEDLDYMP